MTRPANREAALQNSEAMLAALTAFAGVQTESQILSLLDAIMISLFGATKTVLLTRNPSALTDNWKARLAGCASEAVYVTGPEVEERMQRGAIFTSDSPEVDLPGIELPGKSRMAVLVPCSSIAAVNAVCAVWDQARSPFNRNELDQLRALATVAGLAFERHIAAAQACIHRANLENRVRNVLSVIRSVGTRSAERAPSLEQFLLHFEGRIDAIGRSQLAATRDGEISFELLLREELLAETIIDGDDVSLEGMDVCISLEQAEALALAIHELAVNAVKFGPFGAQGGSLTVRWWVEGGAEALALNIDWREKCPQPGCVGRPPVTGFGLTYLERGLPFQLNAETTLDFGARGLSCKISVPLPRRPGQRPRTSASFFGPARQGAGDIVRAAGGPALSVVTAGAADTLKSGDRL